MRAMASPAAHLDNTGRRGWGPALCLGLVGNVEQFRARTPGQFCTVTEERGTLASHFGFCVSASSPKAQSWSV